MLFYSSERIRLPRTEQEALSHVGLESFVFFTLVDGVGGMMRGFKGAEWEGLRVEAGIRAWPDGPVHPGDADLWRALNDRLSLWRSMRGAKGAPAASRATARASPAPSVAFAASARRSESAPAPVGTLVVARVHANVAGTLNPPEGHAGVLMSLGRGRWLVYEFGGGGGAAAVGEAHMVAKLRRSAEALRVASAGLCHVCVCTWCRRAPARSSTAAWGG